MMRRRIAEALSAEILRGPTATAGLTRWCAARGLGEGPVLVAPAPDPAPEEIPPEDAEALEAALALAPGETLLRRRVVLHRGPVILSTADNWFAPDRLPAEIRAALETTATPFGALVGPLGPWRKTLVRRFPTAPGAPPLEHLAVVLDRDGRPLCGVLERYAETAVSATPGDAACAASGEASDDRDAVAGDEE
jgi:hypothetical protein